MMHMKTVLAGTALAGSLGLAALGTGSGVANAAPSAAGSGTQWAQDRGWGGGRGGPGWIDPGRGRDFDRGGGGRRRGGGAPPPPHGYRGGGGGGGGGGGRAPAPVGAPR